MKSLRGFVAVLAGVLIGSSGLTWAQQPSQKAQAPSQQQIAAVQDLATVFRQVGKAVEPSVVSINVRKTVKGHPNLPFDEDMLRRFFPDRDGDGEPDLPEGFNFDGGQMEQIGTGSGVVMEVDGNTGYILTNNHVAGGAAEMEITLADGRTIGKAEVVGTDPKTDLAVLKIEADQLTAAKWGNSDDLQKGDWVMAFGSPFGYVGSMTHGIVSALNRQAGILGQMGFEDFIQVDTPINPGNSGGPLVNIHGEVVGINTAIASRSGGFQGIGFAIPSNLAKYVYGSLRENGKVTRGWIGVAISDVSRDLAKAKSFGFEGTSGVLVEETFPNTPAHGKLQPGDIITEIDGKAVADVRQLRYAVAVSKPGTELKFKVFRDGKNVEVPITVGEQPEDMATATGRGGKAGEAAHAALGVRLSNLTDELAQRYDLQNKQGAVVVGVERGSLAARGGLRPGDLISRIDNQPVENAQQARELLSKADVKKGVRLYVTSRTGSRFLFLQNGE